MKYILLLYMVLLPLELIAAIENSAPESILEGLPEEVLSGLDTVALTGEYILEIAGAPFIIEPEIFNKIEISEGDFKSVVRRNKKRRTVREFESEELLFKTGFE